MISRDEEKGSRELWIAQGDPGTSPAPPRGSFWEGGWTSDRVAPLSIPSTRHSNSLDSLGTQTSQRSGCQWLGQEKHELFCLFLDFEDW